MRDHDGDASPVTTTRESNSAQGDTRVTSESGVDSARRFASNIFWMLLSQAGGKIAGFAFIIIVAHGLGTTDYGYFSFAISFVPLFLLPWGIDIVVVSEIAKDHRRLSEVFSSGFLLRFGLQVIGLLVCFSLMPFLVSGAAARATVVIVGCSLFLDEISGFLGNVFQAFEQMRLQSLITVTNRILSTLLAIVAIELGGNLIAIAFVYFLGSVGALVVAWAALRRRFPPIRLSDRNMTFIRYLLRSGVALGVAYMLNMALFRIDVVLLQAIRGAAAVAMYGIALRFLDSFLFFTWGVMNAVLPRIARASGDSERVRVIEMTAAIMLAFYVPLAIWGLFSAKWMVEAIFPARYAGAASAVPWLAAAGMFYAVAFLVRVLAIVEGQRLTLIWIAAFGVVANVGLNAVIIPQYGFVGAAVVTFVSEVLDAVLLLVLFVRSNWRLYKSRVALVPITAGAVTTLALLGLGAQGARAFLLGGTFYAVALVTSGRLIAPSESKKAIEILRRRPKSATA